MSLNQNRHVPYEINKRSNWIKQLHSSFLTQAGRLNCPPPRGEWFKSINGKGWSLEHRAWHVLFIRSEKVEVNCDRSKQVNTNGATKTHTAAKTKRVLNLPCSPFFILDGYACSNSKIRHVFKFMRAKQPSQTEKPHDHEFWIIICKILKEIHVIWQVHIALKHYI